jgi:hypothetical protein
MAKTRSKVQGEGNYDAARNYNRKLREHVKTSDVDAEARQALPKDQVEAREMELAERVGKRRTKEEERPLRPEIRRPGH